MSSHEITAVMHLAWAVGVWHLLVAGYLVFASERSDVFLHGMALVKGALGGCVYIIVREPEWLFIREADFLLLPVTLALILIFSILVTVALFRLYELAPPWVRARQLYHDFREYRS